MNKSTLDALETIITKHPQPKFLLEVEKALTEENLAFPTIGGTFKATPKGWEAFFKWKSG